MDKLVRTIKAVSIRSKAEGSIGFLTMEEENRWYNIKADEPALDEMLKTMIGKGNVIEFEVENGFPRNFVLKSAATKKEEGNWADDMTSFEELLDDAHIKFKDNFSIQTEMIPGSLDYAQKRVVFKATVSIGGLVNDEESQYFEGHGDSEGIQSEMIKPHFIRMAETRAIARALRWATNNAKVAREETDQEPSSEDLAQP